MSATAYRPPPGSRPDRILAALREHPAGLTVSQLCTVTDPESGTDRRAQNVVSAAVHRMERLGAVRKAGTCRYPVTWQAVTWQAVPERKPPSRPPADRWSGVVMRDPRTLPEPPRGPCPFGEPPPCAHRLMAAVLAEMPPPRKGTLTGAQLKRWYNVLVAIVEAVYGPLDEEVAS